MIIFGLDNNAYNNSPDEFATEAQYMRDWQKNGPLGVLIDIVHYIRTPTQSNLFREAQRAVEVRRMVVLVSPGLVDGLTLAQKEALHIRKSLVADSSKILRLALEWRLYPRFCSWVFLPVVLAVDLIHGTGRLRIVRGPVGDDVGALASLLDGRRLMLRVDLLSGHVSLFVDG
jgi:hypothetical protein